MECSVCLQPCVHPVELPCRHIFCFLCVKGVANRSKRCALCRQEIPQEFFNNPKLVKDDDLQKTPSFEGGYQWFYEGRNGWWQYDERTSGEMERCKDSSDKTVDLLIAGFLYVIDFENMIQYRRNDPTRRRRIKRDLVDIPEKKGVAGLKIDGGHISRRTEPRGQESSSVPVGQQGMAAVSVISQTSAEETAAVLASSVLAVPRNSHMNINQNGNQHSPPPPSNTPQSPAASSAGSSPTLAPLEQELSALVSRLDISLDIPSSTMVSFRNEAAGRSGLSESGTVPLNQAPYNLRGTSSVDHNVNVNPPEGSQRRHRHRRRHSNGETQTHDVENNNNNISNQSRSQISNHDGSQISRGHTPSHHNTRARSRSARSPRE